jgi:hypothetical protein
LEVALGLTKVLKIHTAVGIRVIKDEGLHTIWVATRLKVLGVGSSRNIDGFGNSSALSNTALRPREGGVTTRVLGIVNGAFIGVGEVRFRGFEIDKGVGQILTILPFVSKQKLVRSILQSTSARIIIDHKFLSCFVPLDQICVHQSTQMTLQIFDVVCNLEEIGSRTLLSLAQFVEIDSLLNGRPSTLGQKTRRKRESNSASVKPFICKESGIPDLLENQKTDGIIQNCWA